MLTLVGYLDTEAAELHRHDLLRIAADAKRSQRAAQGADDRVAAPLAAGERQRLLDSLEQMWVAASPTEIETADPLGLWSFGPPRRPLTLPDARTLIDWAAWLLLVLLTGGYLVIRP